MRRPENSGSIATGMARRAGLRTFAALAAALPLSALASGPAPVLSGSGLHIAWALPFAGLLLSIAIVPLFNAHFWHEHYGKVAFAWALLLFVPFAYVHGITLAVHYVVHAIVAEYVPFVAVLFALYTIAGGICVRGSFMGTPWLNTGILALGTALASVMGTTGAAMLLIRPLLTANELRERRVHTVIFFILLVGNVGGALSPLGDPPLFIGFLKGVEFFWPVENLWQPTLLLAGALLAIYFVVDYRLWRQAGSPRAAEAGGPRFRIEGGFNLLLIAVVVGDVLVSGIWDPGIDVDVLGIHLQGQALLRDVLLVGLALLSLKLTPKAIREHNAFHWGPILEVAKIFAAIFVTIFPALAMLAAGRNGALAGVLHLVVDAAGEPKNLALFWTTGLLSAFLDNAPTYLVFFNLTGGDAADLMTAHRLTLAAISMGAVYFGALTYIGNAPNFMIKAVAEDRGIAMPSFFGYIAMAGVIMLPLLALIGFLFL